MNKFRDTPRGTIRLSILRQFAISIIAPLSMRFMRETRHRAEIIKEDDSDAGQSSARKSMLCIRIGEWIEKDMFAVRIFDEYRWSPSLRPNRSTNIVRSSDA